MRAARLAPPRWNAVRLRRLGQRSIAAALMALLALILALAPVCGAESPGPASPEADARGRGQLWLLPSPAAGVLMHALLFRPAGKGPFPLAVINHGSEQDGRVRRRMGLPAYPALTGWLLARGYAVLLPERPGHGATGGPYLEDQGRCSSPDYVRAGERTADSIAAAIGYMTAEPFIRRTGVIVIGHSAGAWGALALAARNPPGVAAVVDFSGGRGGHDRGQPLHNCAPDRLVGAAATFGRTARIPTLWLYAENDTYFGPALSAAMAKAFTAAGGRATYALLPTTAAEGHTLINQPPEVWGGVVGEFLRR